MWLAKHLPSRIKSLVTWKPCFSFVCCGLLLSFCFLCSLFCCCFHDSFRFLLLLALIAWWIVDSSHWLRLVPFPGCAPKYLRHCARRVWCDMVLWPQTKSTRCVCSRGCQQTSHTHPNRISTSAGHFTRPWIEKGSRASMLLLPLLSPRMQLPLSNSHSEAQFQVQALKAYLARLPRNSPEQEHAGLPFQSLSLSLSLTVVCGRQKRPSPLFLFHSTYSHCS